MMRGIRCKQTESQLAPDDYPQSPAKSPLREDPSPERCVSGATSYSEQTETKVKAIKLFDAPINTDSHTQNTLSSLFSHFLWHAQPPAFPEAFLRSKAAPS